jgi:hypothetical protein
VAAAVLAYRLASFRAVVAGGWVEFFFLRCRDRLSRQAQHGLPPAAAPVLLAAGSTIGGHLQPPLQRDDRHRQRPGRPGRGRPVGDDAGVRGSRACEIATGLALRAAAVAGRLILVTGGAAACWSR